MTIFRILILLFVSNGVYSQNNVNNDLKKDTVPVKVYVQFETTRKGKVTNVSVLKTEGGPCSEKDLEQFKIEAIRVVSSSPDYKRKKQKFVIPIKFELEK
jgi:hypothetical protein